MIAMYEVKKKILHICDSSVLQLTYCFLGMWTQVICMGLCVLFIISYMSIKSRDSLLIHITSLCFLSKPLIH